MSVVLLYSLQFTANNPAGGYVAGDEIDIYYDTSDATPTDKYSGLTVKKNGVTITSGIDIFTSSGSNAYVNGTATTTVTCNSSYQITFSPQQYSFPYGFKVATSNAASCPVSGGGIVCNLSFSPNIVVTNASSSSALDGSIQVLATSNYSIKYKIGSDFDYYDGTGQTSGTFSSLISGSYRIYARDTQNCSANILVNLPFDSTYGVKYTVNYINLAGHRTKIDILQKGYAGSSSFVTMGNTPFSLDLRGEGLLDKFQPILASQVTVMLMSQTDLQFSELFTNDPTKYKINYYKDFSGGTSYTLEWSGFVVPQIYSEEYLLTPYNVTVQATDGLPNLSKIAFLHDDGNKYIGTVKAISLLSTALLKTGLSLHIRCGCNLFASTMATTSSDDPLDQSYIDVDTYYLINDTPTWEDVIKAILKSFRARIVQGNGVWNIFRPEEMVSSFNYREYDSGGIYVSNSSYNPITLVKAATASNRLRWRDQDQNLEVRPGYGKLRVKYHLGLKSNILRNGDFSLTSTFNPEFNIYSPHINLYGFQIISPTYPVYSNYVINNPSDINDVSLALNALAATIAKPYGYIQSDSYMMAMALGSQIKFSISIKCLGPFVLGTSVDGNGDTVFSRIPVSTPYQKVRCRIFYGSKYLQNDGTWTTIPTDIIFYLTQFNQFVDFSIVANQPDSTYTTSKEFYVIVYNSVINDYDFSSSSQLKAKITNSAYGTNNNRGNYDASVGLFPSTGGSGGAGAIVAGDYWTVNVSGTINGVFINGLVRVRIKCINSTPGQDSANWLIGELALPIGTRTEVYGLSGIGGIAYFELQNNTSAESIPTIIRPNDYDATNNPNQWILVTYSGLLFQNDMNNYINKISVEYLFNGTTPFDGLVTEISGESNNLLAVEDDIYHGSLETQLTSIVTIKNLAFNNIFEKSPFSQFQSNKQVISNAVTIQSSQIIIAGNLIYTGYYRNSSGVGYVNWTRNGISESNHLHAIWLSTTIAQYKRSWKKITGSLYGDIFMPLVNVIQDLDGTIYLPISLTFDDKMNSYNGEFLELIDISTSSGVTQPFSGGFSQTAFGNGYNI